ncbi:hypothetical protein Taro_030165 [Colocasia esculenta]|uniref:Uncharacterized protein n=1 Tax=Colocasia esculenta TaxID=4460 RepID=A0A843VX34_COLES|nr:hypothetical protein [Colocasia esculenta]
MDNIISFKRDAAILREHKIIESMYIGHRYRGLQGPSWPITAHHDPVGWRGLQAACHVSSGSAQDFRTRSGHQDALRSPEWSLGTL